MTTQNSITRTSHQDLSPAKRIDEIAAGAMEVFKNGGSFESELAVAQAVADLRGALTPEIMQPVMALMNTDLGFRTDRDPKLTPKDKEGNPLSPYGVDVVREVTIEAKLRGFHMIGNEVNIIAGRFYACKNGFRRKVISWPGVTDFKDTYDVPRMVGDKGAIVKCRATWRKDGIADSLEREFPIRVNFGMGADAILGKAQRKLLAAVHDRLSGIITPEGEAGEELEVQPGSAKPSARFAEAKPAVAAEPAGDPPVPAATPKAPARAKPTLVEAPLTPQQELAEIIRAAGYEFAHFLTWGLETGNLTQCEQIKSFEDLPENMAKRFVAARTGLLRALRTNVPTGARG